MKRPPTFCVCLNDLQDSLDELEMDDYWKEVENITSSEGGAAGRAEGEAQEEEQQKTPEGDPDGKKWKGPEMYPPLMEHKCI